VGRCKLCGRSSITISDTVGVCVDCLRERPGEALPIAMRAHERSRRLFDLPLEPPNSGIPCGLCSANCRIEDGGRGFCGVIYNRGGKLERVTGSVEYGLLHYYYDPIPTNCVADWVCPASTGRGYPKYAVVPGPEIGYRNLAVFYGSCNLDCLYCQNWEYREFHKSPWRRVSVGELVGAVDRRTTCVCFFGGDPSSQILHAIMVAREVIERGRREGRVVRICWETNGHIAPKFIDLVVETSLVSGGIVKFDLKAWTPSVYKALTGRDNKVVFENFERAARRFDERKEVPLVVASILLVPGYVDEHEVDMLTKFIARVNPSIPTRFLAFHPDYLLRDLPRTSRRHAENALKIARENGLVEVSVGNVWLLGDYY